MKARWLGPVAAEVLGLEVGGACGNLVWVFGISEWRRQERDTRGRNWLLMTSGWWKSFLGVDLKKIQPSLRFSDIF